MNEQITKKRRKYKYVWLLITILTLFHVYNFNLFYFFLCVSKQELKNMLYDAQRAAPEADGRFLAWAVLSPMTIMIKMIIPISFP